MASSILFECPEDQVDKAEAPAFFSDLNCDQIVAAITAGREEYNLAPFFHAPLRRIGTIVYRQEVMQDLETCSLREKVNAFAERMRDVRAYLARVEKLYYPLQRQAWFLDAVDIYCQAVRSFAQDLSAVNINSRALKGFRNYLSRYVGSAGLNLLAVETSKIRAGLASIQYTVQIKPGTFTVRRYQGEADYSAEVEATFAKFKQGAARNYLVKFKDRDEDMNHIEAKILEFVAKLHPDIFQALDHFCSTHGEFIDPGVALFEREVQFYLAYLDYIRPLKEAGLRFCYPRLSERSKEVCSQQGFDIALAHKLIADKKKVVCNDFYLAGAERILVVSGPNQGGKTTFARAFGQLHYLANIGCPVPGSSAQLLHFDRLFTHFEREERVENLRGKLEDDLIRIRKILDRATPRSVIVMNEIFTSTTIQDETFLSKKVMERLIALDCLCVWVTFVDELASFGPQTVSMVSTVVPDNPALRTFKIVRRPADGLAYAMAIAQKHGLTYDCIRGRLKS
jgi:DNA mismatch repair ATPase MutS